MARKPPPITLKHPISKALFLKITQAVREAGYKDAIHWSENVQPPASAKQFAKEAIYVICNSGMKNSVAIGIFNRCITALESGQSAKTVFGHPGKSAAIDDIWRRRLYLFGQYKRSSDPIEFCASLPWIGPITKFHLAKNFGTDVAKPDVHMVRLAEAENTNSQELCKRLALETGYRAATVDMILWRACADGIIHSRPDQPAENQ